MKIKRKKIMTLLVSAMITVPSLSLSGMYTFAENSNSQPETNVSDISVTTVAGEIQKSEEEENKDPQNSEIISEGYTGEYIGEEGSSPYYKCYKDGSVIITGSGILRYFTPKGFDENPLFTKVTVIGDKDLTLDTGVFNNDYYKSIDLSQTQIKELPNVSFKGCKKFEELILPSSLEKVNVSAFYGNEIPNIELPNNVRTIEKEAFAFTKFKELVLPEKLEYIGIRAFHGSNIENVTFNKNLTTMANEAFYRSEIESAVLPESLKYVGDEAFFGCKNLKKVVINSEFETNDSEDGGSRIFASCSKLQTVYLSDNVKTIQSEQFAGCSKLNEIKLSNNLKTIKYGAFMSTGFKEITIPESVDTIEDDAFAICSYLNKVTILNPKCSIGDHIISHGVIYGYRNSTAQEYAAKNGIKFVALDSEPITTVSGDVNGDNAINLKDVVMVRRYVAGGWGVELDEKVADVNGDGTVNLKDVVMLRRYIAGGWNVTL